MKKFEVCDMKTDRTYEVGGDENTTLEMVWRSQMSWFSSGALVKITDENGNCQMFEKE